MMPGLVAWSLAALAQAPSPPPAVRLVLDGQPGTERCPTATDLETAVAARLGRTPFAPDATADVTVVIEPQPEGGYTATLTLHDATGGLLGQRVLRGGRQDCADLAAGMPVALALALDQWPQPAAAPPPSPPVAPKPAATPPAPAFHAAPTRKALPVSPRRPDALHRRPRRSKPRFERSPPLPVRPELRQWWLQTGAHGLGTLGALPSAAPAGAVSAGLGVWRISAHLELRATFPSLRWDAPRPVTGSLYSLMAAGCYTAWQWSGCALAGGGALLLVTVPANGGVGFSPHAVLGGRWRWDAPLSQHLWAHVLVDVTSPLVHTRVTVDGKDWWRTPPLQLSSGAGLSVRL